MFKLVTGLPGAGKTSNELWKFLHSSEYKGRPKYCTPVNGFDAKAHGVIQLDHIKDWQDLPQGSVIFCDEVQDYCGTDLGKEPPEWVKQISRHRHGGYDFIVTTQNPMMLHPYARKLVQPHVHYTKPYGMKVFSYQWETAQGDPNSKSAKNIGQRTSANPPKEVFSLYTSTVLDTHKARPPYKILITFGIFLLLAIGCTAFGVSRVLHIGEKPKQQPAQVETPKPAQPLPSVSELSKSVVDVPPPPPSSTVWTAENMKPRIAGEAYTAPVYDNLTAPTDFPRVAACMSSKSRNSCNCYTQQGTPLDVPRSACEVFVKVGHFDPWLQSRKQAELAQQSARQGSPVEATPAPKARQQAPAEPVHTPQLVAQEQTSQTTPHLRRASFRVGQER